MKKFKEYIAPKYSRYQEPVRNFCDEVLEIRLYCRHKGCRVYILGKEGYNGSFAAETGQTADLRNQVWYCTKHQEKLGSKEKLFLKLTPIGVWLRPSQKNFKKHGIRTRVIDSLRRKKYIETSRIIGGGFDSWNFRVRRLK